MRRSGERTVGRWTPGWSILQAVERLCKAFKFICGCQWLHGLFRHCYSYPGGNAAVARLPVRPQAPPPIPPTCHELWQRQPEISSSNVSCVKRLVYLMSGVSVYLKCSHSNFRAGFSVENHSSALLQIPMQHEKRKTDFRMRWRHCHRCHANV